MTLSIRQKPADMTKKQWLALLLVNLGIALGFFFENKGTGFTQLSSDLHNSIPVCYKLDDDALFQKDLYLYDVNNVRYYTPFYIQTIRFFAWCAGGDYLLGLNIFATLLHLVYGLLWFLLFRKVFGKFLLALFLSVLVRGILWLPGLEIWGISDVWTMMPRTMYAAFLPLPLLLMLQQTRKTFYASALLIGLLFNFHPITGMGGSLLFLLVVALYCWLWEVKIPLRDIAMAALLMLVGMLPFVATYFTQTDTKAVYDIAEYKKAFFTRIPEFFEQPMVFLKLWIRGSSVITFGPLVLFWLYARFRDKSYLKVATLLALVSVGLVLIFSLSVPVENAFNAAMGTNLRMAFQMIRAQKLAVLPGYFAIGFLLKIALEQLPVFHKVFKFGVPLFILGLVFAKEPPLKKIPFFKDDIATSIFPDFRVAFASEKDKPVALDRMMDYINAHTPQDAVFYGTFMIRSACRRSVVLDGKGASMLIEGNPTEFIRWYQENQTLDTLPTDAEKISFLKNTKQVTHIFSSRPMSGNLTLLHREDNFYLYKVE